MEYLDDKTFRIIVDNGKDGILQTNLWKRLDLTGRNGSRIATRLEKRSLIIREKIRHDGRWTYRLFAAKLPADTQCIEQAPCLTCPVEHMCSVESAYSPNNCSLIEEWALLSFPSNSPEPSLNQYEQLQNRTSEKELVVREAKPATRRRAQRIAKNSKKRSFN